MSELEFHPDANLFPLMTGAEYDALKADIQAHGQHEPIYTWQGQIVDGRNRYRACQDLGIPCLMREWDGRGSLVGFIVSLNLHRRHLTPSQCVCVAVDMLPMFEAEAKKRQGKRNDLTSVKDLTEVILPQRATEQAAKATGTNRQYISDAKRIKEESPETFAKIVLGEMTLPEAKRETAKAERDKARAEVAIAGAAVAPSDRWYIYQGDIRTWTAPRQYDFIITDPPYPKEYLPLWESLAERAAEWLKPDGLLIAMSGQSYLDEIYKLMGKHLSYYWTSCYLTPHQPTPLRQKQVNTSWKPLLVYSLNGDYSGKTFGDVYTSPQPGKDNHDWEQSVDGMLAIIKQVCLPGQYILDPFCGAGTTGVAAIKHGCLFDGLEMEQDNVNISKGRLNDQAAA